MAGKPGARFNYNSGNSVLLMKILEQEVDEHSVGYADRRLFQPLGIESYYWLTDTNMTASGDTGLMMSPRDMAKIGMLFLYNGQWEDQQLVSSDWVQDSTASHIKINSSGTYYGYHWWMNRDGFYATGYGGQNIFVYPQWELVVVTTAGEASGISWDPITRGIFPATVSNQQIEENPEGYSSLTEMVQQVSSPPVPQDIEPLPKISALVEGQVFDAEANQMGIKSLSFDFKDDHLEVWVNYEGFQVSWAAGLNGVYQLRDVYEFGSYTIPLAARAHWENEYVLIIDAQL
jgi:hypothetical protein